MKFKIIINDNLYTSWKLYNADTLKEITEKDDEHNIIENFNPLKYKLFSEDVFEIDVDKKFTLIHSVSRHLLALPGVLRLSEKTYGNSLNNKAYYKCIPDDKRLPIFLIPYQEKRAFFIKNKVNKYVLFTFESWDDKHPIGKLSQTLGDVNDIIIFYEYQLYCKSLNASINKFTKDTSIALKKLAGSMYIKNIVGKYKNIEDRQDDNIITIDPPNSMDFDDAISIKVLNDESINDRIPNKYIISVYISNVTLWMDYLNLWSSFSNRISTIYLPDRKRPMLPTILSDSLCSLQENESRLAFCMDILIEDNIIIDISFKNTLIRVKRNYIYEEDDLYKDKIYNSLYRVTRKIFKNHKYITHIKTSHDIISYYMILMNYETSKIMSKYKNGIYRSVVLNTDRTEDLSLDTPDCLPDDINNFIKIWNCSSGQYTAFNNTCSHDLIGPGLETYLHITSPIRRLVDLLNLIQIQKNLNLLTLQDESITFYNKWLNNLDYINITMRAIRKIQNDCSLLDLCIKDPSIMNTIYKGYMFDKLCRNDGLYQYTVYLPEIKMLTRTTLRTNYKNYMAANFKMYLFTNEANFKKKIRLQLID